MVRFHWAVEGGQNAFVAPGGIEPDASDPRVRHLSIEMELAGQNETCAALLTLPASYLDASSLRDVGLVLAHGADADQWRTDPLEALARDLAVRGHVVMRYFCRAKEQRRQRILERALDVAAASPVARGVRHWVLAGYDNGARIAASVGAKPRVAVAAFLLLSYPLLEPAPPPPKQKAGAVPPVDSAGALLRLAVPEDGSPPPPVLFLLGQRDERCPSPALARLVREEAPALDAWALLFPNADAAFCRPGSDSIAPETQGALHAAVLAFVDALAAGDLPACALPRLAALGETS